MRSVVEFRDFTFTYLGQKKPSLKKVDLKIEEGTTVGIVGPTGSGKSTLLMALNGLIPQEIPGLQEGDVIVNGLNTREHDVSELACHVGIVLDNPVTQLVALTVMDDIAFGPSNLGLTLEEIDGRIKFAIKATGLQGFEKRNPKELSGGEQQSLAIAGILAMKPKVLAMNEPVALLDPMGKERVFSVIKEITHTFKTTSVIAESGADLEALIEYLDRVIILHRGEVLMDDLPSKVVQSGLLEEIDVGRPQLASLFMKLRKNDTPVPYTFGNALKLLRSRFKEGVPRRIIKTARGPESVRGTLEEPMVKVRDLRHVYRGGVEALKGVSFDLHGGEFVGLIGQNGSGKTTLCYHIVGILKPTNPDARVLVGGLDVTKAPIKKIIEHANYVFQNPNDQLFQETVQDEVAYALRLKGLPEQEVRERVDKMLKLFGIEDHRDEYVPFCPRDIKTLVSIASVLVSRPEVLLIDEPTTGLDYGRAEAIMDLLSRLNRSGLTLLVISHNMEFVAKYCDRVMVMKEGRIIVDGPTREVFSKPEVLAQANIKPPKITQLFQELSDLGFPRDVLGVDEAYEILRGEGVG